MRDIKLGILALFAVILSGFVQPAFADAKTEAFVKEHADKVLTLLDNQTLDATARTETFIGYMDEFSNIDRIAAFVIGKYSRRFSPEDLSAYRAAFRLYNLTAYEMQFEEYRGSAIEITGSTDRSATDSIVDTIVRRQNGDTQDVRWRVLSRNGKYEVVDIALNFDGSLLWLAIEQRAQFLDLLDRTNGSADALVSKLEELTAELRED